MNIKQFVGKNKTELAAIGLLLGGSTGPISDMMDSVGLDLESLIDLILTTNGNTLILWAIIAALYFRKETPDEKIKEQVEAAIKERLDAE